MRLKPIAAVRAPTIASTMATMRPTVIPWSRAAMAAAASANGMANTVWLNLIIRPNVATAASGAAGAGTRVWAGLWLMADGLTLTLSLRRARANTRWGPGTRYG